MDVRIILYTMFVLAVILASLLILLIPLKALAVLTKPFSFKTFGIRKIEKWHSRTDTLGNLVMIISFAGCLFLPWIPNNMGRWVYAGWLTFTWLCTLSRAVRMSQVPSDGKKLTVIFFINCIYGVSLLAGAGIMDGMGLWTGTCQWLEALESQEALKLVYYLTKIGPLCYLIVEFIMIMSLMILWGQFKYMRLENRFKARNLFTYVVKSLIQIAVIVALGIFGLETAETIYNVREEDRVIQHLLPGIDLNSLDFSRFGF